MTINAIKEFCAEYGIFITLKGNKEAVVRKVISALDNATGYAILSGNEMDRRKIEIVKQEFYALLQA